MSRSVLVVEDEESLRHVLTVILEEHGYGVRAVEDGEAALAELERREYDFLITDVRMPGLGGLELLAHVRKMHPDLTVIVMSAYGSHESAIEAMKQGAYDYISKPFRPDEVVLVLRKAEEREELRRENERLKRELRERTGGGLEGIVGDSPRMRAVLEKVRRVAAYKTTVLLHGESGTGKELVARAIHELSPRAAGPFVPVNCGAIPETLMESELFGHVKGAFTGADRARPGLIREAQGGTLFLDEIGELPSRMQVKLLRFLQEDEIRRVGDSRTETVDVRVVAATARDLQDEVKAGRFREDLYYRLSVVPLHLPPLRERPGDVPRLVEHFLSRLARRLEKPQLKVTEEAMARLASYPWPGNVRELENTLEQAAVLC
ncbi:MAG: sigma-54-dependent Fis family transcriptional regulator, partial [Deltaproteobacteria bacterium]